MLATFHSVESLKLVNIKQVVLYFFMDIMFLPINMNTLMM